ncbi:hypothetical protein [Thermocrispum municipale]|jgi:hypothetical protein|uniref:hypothetical protein n=1 Tax=Thermocrispum municipale TaxID=37926 RepID=UPI0004076AB1|nr:hypothetical protein [Thermocrispum municipale]
MSLFRKDDRVNEDLVDEISDSFNRAMQRKQRREEAHEAEEKKATPRFLVTGDQRDTRGRPG